MLWRTDSSNLQHYVHIWHHSYNSLYLLLLIKNSVHTDFHDSELPSYIHFSDTVVLTVYWLMVYIMARGLVLLSFSFKCYTMGRTKCFTPIKSTLYVGGSHLGLTVVHFIDTKIYTWAHNWHSFHLCYIWEVWFISSSVHKWYTGNRNDMLVLLLGVCCTLLGPVYML